MRRLEPAPTREEVLGLIRMWAAAAITTTFLVTLVSRMLLGPLPPEGYGILAPLVGVPLGPALTRLKRPDHAALLWFLRVYGAGGALALGLLGGYRALGWL